MNRIPVIDLTATGINIARLRVNADLTVIVKPARVIGLVF